MTIAETLESLIDGYWTNPDRRHPVIRTGEREPISNHIRAAIWFRDGGRCDWCESPEPVKGPWHLDHIAPWSAGGSDRSANLRVLCERHNIERSNRIDPFERPRMPVTWWCATCWSPDAIERWKLVEMLGSLVPIECPSHRYGRCRIVRGYARALAQTSTYPDWHSRRPAVEIDFGPAVYCAHCDAPSITDLVL